MSGTRRRKCFNCDKECGDGAIRQLRFRYLCARCVSKGYKLTLFTNEALAHRNRKWVVGVTWAGQRIK